MRFLSNEGCNIGDADTCPNGRAHFVPKQQPECVNQRSTSGLGDVNKKFKQLRLPKYRALSQTRRREQSFPRVSHPPTPLDYVENGGQDEGGTGCKKPRVIESSDTGTFPQQSVRSGEKSLSRSGIAEGHAGGCRTVNVSENNPGASPQQPARFNESSLAREVAVEGYAGGGCLCCDSPLVDTQDKHNMRRVLTTSENSHQDLRHATTYFGALDAKQTTGQIKLSRTSCEEIRVALETELLREECKLARAHRQLGFIRGSTASSDAYGLDMSGCRTLSEVIRKRNTIIDQAARFVRGETDLDSRPNKALDPDRLEQVLHGYEHVDLIVKMARVGIEALRTDDAAPKRPPAKKHGSCRRYLRAVTISFC
jgi:hypothetical protein